MRRRLGELDLLVVCDVVPSETAALADVVLPVTQWAEEEGTMTSLEGRVLRRRQLLEPAGLARSELEVLADLAERLGSPVPLDRDPAVVFDELARASAGGRADYSGLSHAGPRRREPRSSGRSPRSATPRLFADAFAHPDGRPGWCRSRRVVRPTTCARRPGLPRHRPGAGAVPVRRPDPSRPGAEPDGTRRPSSSCTRSWRSGSTSTTATTVAVTSSRGHGDGAGPDHRLDPSRHRVHALPLGRRGVGQRGHQRRVRPGLRDAGVQGVRGLGRPADRGRSATVVE